MRVWNYFLLGVMCCLPAFQLSAQKARADYLLDSAIVFEDQGAIVKALDYCNQSLKLARETNNKPCIAKALYQMADIYIVQGDFVKSFPYSQESEKLMKEIGDEKGLADCSETIGNYIEFQEHDLEKALACYEKGLSLCFRIGYKKRASYLLGNVARVYFKQKKYKEALKYNLKSLELKNQTGDKKGAGYSLHKIGQIYYEQGDYAQALEYGQKSLSVGKEIGFPDNIKRSADLLNKVFKKTGNYKEAYEMFELYITMRDSINNVELQKKAIQQQIQFEYEQKLLKDKIEQEKREAINREQQQTQKIINLASITVAILLLAFAVFIFRSLRRSNRQKHLIEEKHREIRDSINYAERIQRSFMATQEMLDENLKDYFIFFLPKDVVSGDFYWAATLENGNFALVTADSTGHGVPGAIMSLLNISSLEKSIEASSEPKHILNTTRKIIIERLKKDGSSEGGKDGMDCSFISLEPGKRKLSYAAANNPVWIVRNKTLIELKPDKMPVGKHDKDSFSFNQNDFELLEGDVIYTLTDGMPDQFGGPKGKKFMYKALKEFLSGVSDKSMAEQKQLLQALLSDWMGSNEQVDDITIIGIRV